MGATSRELTERISAIVEKCRGGVYETSIANSQWSGLSGTRRREIGEMRANERGSLSFIATLESETRGSLLHAWIYCRDPIDWLASVAGDDISIVERVYLDKTVRRVEETVRSASTGEWLSYRRDEPRVFPLVKLTLRFIFTFAFLSYFILLYFLSFLDTRCECSLTSLFP